MHSHTVEIAQTYLMDILLVFVLGIIASKLAIKWKIPDVALFLVVGLILGPDILSFLYVDPHTTFNQTVLIFGAAFILFHGGVVTEISVLRKVWFSITLLSTTGVIITSLAIGYLGHLWLNLPFMLSFLMGAILASTDPASLVPIFDTYPIRPKVSQTVITESAFTDATGAILTILVFGMYTSSNAVHPWGIIVDFLHLALGGILVGIIIGGLIAYLLSQQGKKWFHEYTPVLIIIAVIASYLVAERLGASGFMSVFVAGLMLGNAQLFGWNIDEPKSHSVHNFIDNISLKVRMLIFVFLGTQVEFSMFRDHGLTALVIALILIAIARPLTVLLSLLPDRKANWTKNEILFFFWTREVGVIAAALVGFLSAVMPKEGPLLTTVVFVSIILTLGIQATTTPLVSKWLGLSIEKKQHPQSSLPDYS